MLCDARRTGRSRDGPERPRRRQRIGDRVARARHRHQPRRDEAPGDLGSMARVERQGRVEQNHAGRIRRRGVADDMIRLAGEDRIGQILREPTILDGMIQRQVGAAGGLRRHEQSLRQRHRPRYGEKTEAAHRKPKPGPHRKMRGDPRERRQKRGKVRREKPVVPGRRDVDVREPPRGERRAGGRRSHAAPITPPMVEGEHDALGRLPGHRGAQGTGGIKYSRRHGRHDCATGLEIR
ncbi:hypothetical protein BD830_10196 [Maritimibacter alkaliphilus HTCC2654]|uniref:hypothetical protein n=1 Tax=Maritimibacter alkaliphilus TaxID=404236 RepID=UPI000A0166E2|nr:hypothetical protein BD830_10196 [Maritimibacter alkaliphilus HTCC2654]